MLIGNQGMTRRVSGSICPDHILTFSKKQIDAYPLYHIKLLITSSQSSRHDSITLSPSRLKDHNIWSRDLIKRKSLMQMYTNKTCCIMILRTC